MKGNSLSFVISQIRSYLLPVLAATFGLQFLRSFIPGLAWYLRDTVAMGTLSLIPYAFGTFALGLLAPLVCRLLGTRPALWLTAGGMAVIRVAEQICRAPAFDLWLNIAGVVLFLNFLPIFIGSTRESSVNASERWTYSLVLGFALDTGLRGIFGPRDLSTVGGTAPLLITILSAGLILWSLAKESRPASGLDSDSRGNPAWGLLFIGPYLLLQLLYFQNPGWIEETAGILFPSGFVIVMLGYLVAARGLELGYARPRLLHPILAAALGTALAITVFMANHLGGFGILLVLLGQFFLGWGLAGIGSNNELGIGSGLWRTTLAVCGGMVVFLILAFAYFIALDLVLPVPRDSFPAAAAGLLAVLITAGAIPNRARPNTAWDHSGVIAAGAMVLVPLLCWATVGSNPPAPAAGGFPIKVMTYNIHSGFNLDGAQDLEAIARVIEESGADIIGVQEISRGVLMDGSPDMAAWLSRRLGMDVLFMGTEGPIWGNALFSRYPIIDWGESQLPREGATIGRGYLWAEIDLGEGDPLLVIVTHLHHIVDDSEIRQVQVPVILEFWGQRKQVVLLGDFNAEPGSAEMDLILQGGMVDSWAESGAGDGGTYPAIDPLKRIDFIWRSPDLAALEIEVIHSPASDHMPVIGKFTVE